VARAQAALVGNLRRHRRNFRAGSTSCPPLPFGRVVNALDNCRSVSDFGTGGGDLPAPIGAGTEVAFVPIGRFAEVNR
jgi:hypothetical protein